MALIDTFESHFRRNDASGCLEWTRAADKDGYGRVQVGPTLKFVHRVAYERAFGAIPSGRWVLHRCDNPRCGEPAHLFLGDARTNVADKVAKGRQARGIANGRANLTDDDVREIRRAYASGVRQVDLAAQFRIHQTHVSLIVRRKEWTHVKDNHQ